MPDLVALRERVLALVDRKAHVAAAVREIQRVEVRLDATMLAHGRSWLEDDEDEGHLDGEPGERLPFLSDTVLYAIQGGGGSGDWRARSFVGNTLGAFRDMAGKSATDCAVTRGEEPSLDGLTPFEVGAVVDAYKALASGMTEELRDMATRMRYLRHDRCQIPDYAKSRCLGLFGGADSDLGYAYTERDFARYATTETRVPRADPDDPRGPFEIQRVNHHPQILSARYLAPLIGPEAASRVEAALCTIEEATRPLPGEPPVLRTFGSHSTNRIEIAYEPGEVDIEPAGGMPRP